MIIDERAMEAGFEILGAAIHKGEIGKYPEDDWRLFRRAIEAYEAARWRPIEEATQCPGQWVIVTAPHLSPAFFAARVEGDRAIWKRLDEKIESALFRTIEPPPQK